MFRLFSTTALCLAAVRASGPTVTTSGGPISGVALPASSGGSAVSQFLAIPFARAARFEPPVSELRAR